MHQLKFIARQSVSQFPAPTPREVYNCHSAGVYYVLSYLHRVSRAGGESHGKRFKDAPAAELQRHRVRTMGVVVPVIVLAKVCGQ